MARILSLLEKRSQYISDLLQGSRFHHGNNLELYIEDLRVPNRLTIRKLWKTDSSIQRSRDRFHRWRHMIVSDVETIVAQDSILYVIVLRTT